MSLDTRGNDPQRLLPQSVEERLLGLIARMGGVVLLVAVALGWLCLVSWSLQDPSLTHATAASPRNLLGPLGAIVSDLLLQTFGIVAVLAFLPPLLWSVELVRAQRLTLGRPKIVFYPIAVLAVAGALASVPAVPNWPLNHGLGGAIGDGLFALASKLFGLVNKERADLAAALLLDLSAAAAVAKSTGLDLQAVAIALLEGRPERPEKAPSAGLSAPVRPSVAASLRRWWQAGAHKAATADGAEHDIAAQALDLPGTVMDDQTQQDSSGYEAPNAAWQWGAAAYAPVANALDRLAAIAERQEERLAALSKSAASDFDGPAQSATEALVEDDQHAFRGDGFDLSTDAASHAIAARFAPASQERLDAEPQEDVPPAKPARSSGANPSRAPAAPRNDPRVKQWKRPSLNLLKRAAAAKPGPDVSQTVMRGNARLLEDVLNDFGVKGEVRDIKPGPVVTLYELEPARGTKSSRVIGLADDIARSMSVGSVRAAVVPGRNAIGLELPNMRRESVLLREMLESEAYRSSDATLPLTLGKSIAGEPIVADLARMPHLLVAGTTGSGKSVGINAFILSLLYRHSPNECRMLMIDPKMLELSVYNGIPHLLTPVVTDPHKAVVALNWAVGEMEERYKRMATLSVRNIDVFNNRVRNALKRGEMLSRTVQTGFDKAGQAIFEKQKMTLEPMPHIVIVVDEFADLMAVAGKEVEGAVQRLAQMARAAGIHLIMATQRPSVDVITGTIKANFPTRISFKVTSKIDSRTILNEQGAEQLLGQGDMLYSGGAGQIVRVHGAFVSDEEVEAIADSLRQQGGPQYIEGILDAPESVGGAPEPNEADLYDRAVAIVLRDRKASTSYLQRRLSIGYNRAADLIERMEREGLISAASATGKRDILAGNSRVDAA